MSDSRRYCFNSVHKAIDLKANFKLYTDTTVAGRTRFIDLGSGYELDILRQ